jgi:hypothetical protein
VVERGESGTDVVDVMSMAADPKTRTDGAGNAAAAGGAITVAEVVVDRNCAEGDEAGGVET